MEHSFILFSGQMNGKMKQVIGLLAGFIIIGMWMGLISCSRDTEYQHSNVSNTKETYRYYYYPHQNMYYDIANKNFVYSLDGGRSWQQKRIENRHIVDRLGNKVAINDTSLQPWLINAEHARLYGGIVHNLNKTKQLEAEKIALQNDAELRKTMTTTEEPQSVGNSTFGYYTGYKQNDPTQTEVSNKEAVNNLEQTNDKQSEQSTQKPTFKVIPPPHEAEASPDDIITENEE